MGREHARICKKLLLLQKRNPCVKVPISKGMVRAALDLIKVFSAKAKSNNIQDFSNVCKANGICKTNQANPRN
jgi:hypothetical protein